MRYYVLLAALLFCAPSKSGYDANISGVVTSVLTYTFDGRIYIRLANQFQSHPQWMTDFFSVDASVPDSARSQLLARLLVAYTNGDPVNIGYDSQGDCSHGRIRVYRIG